MSFKKIDKEFLLTDSTVNCYGFRLLTSGYQMQEYQKNPIGYFMHEREEGVLVKWEDFRTEGDSVYAKPVINLSNPRAQQTIDEIEDGFLNAASVGHIVVLEYSDDQTLRLDGQNGITITKWFNRECSLVDIPGNFNALKLYDEKENELNLADFTVCEFNPNPKLDMKTIELSAGLLATLNLKADAEGVEALTKINDLAAKAQKADELQITLDNLNASVNSEKIKTALATAVSEKKITVEASNLLAVDFANNPDGLKNLLATMPAYQSVSSQLDADKDKVFGADLAAKSWTELQESGVLEDLKAKNPEVYKTVFKKEFGKDPII